MCLTNNTKHVELFHHTRARDKEHITSLSIRTSGGNEPKNTHIHWLTQSKTRHHVSTSVSFAITIRLTTKQNTNDGCLLACWQKRKKEVGYERTKERERDRASGFVASSSPPAMQFLCVDEEWVRQRAGGLFGWLSFVTWCCYSERFSLLFNGRCTRNFNAWRRWFPLPKPLKIEDGYCSLVYTKKSETVELSSVIYELLSSYFKQITIIQISCLLCKAGLHGKNETTELFSVTFELLSNHFTLMNIPKVFSFFSYAKPLNTSHIVFLSTKKCVMLTNLLNK